MFIVVYGVWKGRGSRDVRGYLLSNRDMKWYTVALSVMATQASAITFLSTPGQAFTDGMRFIQFYFGLPLAMIVLCVTVVPLYHKLNVYTAYEYLEGRFDLKTRLLAAVLFLIQRGLAAGLTIYAPSIILSTLLGWDPFVTNLGIGGLVIIYTTSGGSRAVNWTQFHQMLIILFGIATAFAIMMYLMPGELSIVDALRVAGVSGKLNTIDMSLDFTNRYNIWSGLIGGLFLQLAYFGTDQSQVQRYLTGESVAQSRLGLIFNGLAKIPMQFFILLLGALLFVFYQFAPAPLFYNPLEAAKVRESAYGTEYTRMESMHRELSETKSRQLHEYLEAKHRDDATQADHAAEDIQRIEEELRQLRASSIELMRRNDAEANTNDTNYIFLTFVLAYLPAGIVGLVLAAIFAASMSSTSSEINALASTTLIDVYRRLHRRNVSERRAVAVTRGATVVWGLFAILFADFANHLGSLIEAVNIIGSLFYGTILGIFLTAFYLRRVEGKAVFTAALIAEALVLGCFAFTELSFLWYNVVGCIATMGIAVLLQSSLSKRAPLRR